MSSRVYIKTDVKQDKLAQQLLADLIKLCSAVLEMKHVDKQTVPPYYEFILCTSYKE